MSGYKFFMGWGYIIGGIAFGFWFKSIPAGICFSMSSLPFFKLALDFEAFTKIINSKLK